MPIKETIFASKKGKGQVPVHIYTDTLDDASRKQLLNVASLPFIFKHVAAMPDVHAGLGSVIGSVIPTEKAVMPAAVGVDIGCGLQVVPLNVSVAAIKERAEALRLAIEKAVPHGRSHQGGPQDRGAWHSIPPTIRTYWEQQGLQQKLPEVLKRHPKLLHKRVNTDRHLGTLGTGNHFIEVCLDETEHVWVMLHSGSRGIGNRIGTYFIALARQEMGNRLKQLPDPDLAYFREGSRNFDDYVQCVQWAQNYAKANRCFMMDAVLTAIGTILGQPVNIVGDVIDCHHNTLEQEEHFNRLVWVTRKGAIRAGKGEWGVIPGSMGAKSYIVKGKGNRASFCSSAHGAGRKMSRREACRRFDQNDLIQQTIGVACRKDKNVIDEIPSAYKEIDTVMAQQSDLVEVVHTLKQLVCVKG